MTIGRLERVALREVWRHEALDFTKWLRDNIDVLNDVIDVTIANVERERPAGTFSVDLVGEDDAGSPVVIENQLEKSDHDHLGKLITYLTAFEARTAIWIVADPRPEHVAAVTWLNQTTPASFYLLKVEAVRISGSPPAPLLTRIVGPSVESREVGETKQDIAERHVLRQQFWTALLERARLRTQLHANSNPSQATGVGASAGVPGISLNYWAYQHAAGVYLGIYRKSTEDNKRIFDLLLERRAEIERDFGASLEWNRYDDRRGSSIVNQVCQQGYKDPEEQWPRIQDAMIDAMIRLERTFRPHITALQM